MDLNYPIVIFCFNRPLHLKQTIKALKRNIRSKESVLYIFSDGPRNQEDDKVVFRVREIIDKTDGFKKVISFKSDTNKGLAKSVIEGVTKVLEKHEACIVLEDDLETSPYFLDFMNEGLNVYKSDLNIFSISGYCPPISIPEDYPYEAFKFPRINSWGWGTWSSRWECIDWEILNFNRFIGNKSMVRLLEQQGKDLPVMLLKQKTGKIGSWAVRFNQTCFEEQKTNIYPVRSLVRNIGIDGSGTHMTRSDKYSVELSPNPLSPSPSLSDDRISRNFSRFYRPSWFRQGINKLKINHYLRSIR